MSASKRIVIAENDENDRILMQWAFKRAGLNSLIVFARDGQEAIEFLQKKSDGQTEINARLLLLDLRMPKLDGFEVLKWLQRNRHLRPPHVVVFSSSCDPSDIEQAKALGADDYKVKPHGLQNCMELVREFEMCVFDDDDSAKADSGGF